MFSFFPKSKHIQSDELEFLNCLECVWLLQFSKCLFVLCIMFTSTFCNFLGLVKLTTATATDPTAPCEPGAFYNESFRTCEKHKKWVLMKTWVCACIYFLIMDHRHIFTVYVYTGYCVKLLSCHRKCLKPFTCIVSVWHSLELEYVQDIKNFVFKKLLISLWMTRRIIIMIPKPLLRGCSIFWFMNLVPSSL